MASKKIYLLILMLFINSVRSDSIFERSYEYVKGLGKNLAPSLMSILDCFGEEDVWFCAREKAGNILDSWDAEVQKQRRSWQDAADAEVASSGRSFEEMPSKLGKEIEDSLTAATDLVQNSMARALARKKHESGGIDSITISTGGDKKKKMKKKQKPAKIHLIHPVMMRNEKKGVMEGSLREGRGIMNDLWSFGDKALDAMAEHAIESDNSENGVVDRSSVAEQRGKKKKKKKAILKLLILGAVLKAKIGTLLQILSFKLQVKFFIIALIGLGINLARFWVELKNKHQQQPQKVIYYEHAQHQHHYDHEEEPAWGPWSRSIEPEETEADVDVIYYEHAQHQHHYDHEEEPAWGPWSRSIEPEETEADVDVSHSPYRGHERIQQIIPNRPLLTLS